MNCKDKGYEEGQVFKVVKEETGKPSVGTYLVLIRDDGSSIPFFHMLDEEQRKLPKFRSNVRVDGLLIHALQLNKVERVWPPEEKSTMVTVICEGKETEISRESAEKLNLV